MKTALITGASGEIGAAVARHFAGAGYGVAVHGAKHFEAAQALAEALSAEGRTAFAVQGDLSNPEACARVWAESESALGPIDVLVNGAGISRFRRPHGTRSSAQTSPPPSGSPSTRQNR